MATIISASVNAAQIQKAANEKGYTNISVIINDELDKGTERFTPKFPQNVKVTLGQTKEQRDAKEKKTYVGNGQTVWSSDGIKTAKEMEQEDPGWNEGPGQSHSDNSGDGTDEIPF